jgi:hypothetical protein
MQVKIKYGTGNELSKDFPAGTTIGCVLGNQFVRGALGYGQNVQGFVNSVPQNDSTYIAEGMTISVHDKACTKAGRTVTVVIALADDDTMPETAAELSDLFYGIDDGASSSTFTVSATGIEEAELAYEPVND